MGAKGTFNIPDGSHVSTAGAREAYRKVWGKEWPHDDGYLRVLAREVPRYPVGESRTKNLLVRMRESHEF